MSISSVATPFWFKSPFLHILALHPLSYSSWSYLPHKPFFSAFFYFFIKTEFLKVFQISSNFILKCSSSLPDLETHFFKIYHGLPSILCILNTLLTWLHLSKMGGFRHSTNCPCPVHLVLWHHRNCVTSKKRVFGHAFN